MDELVQRAMELVPELQAQPEWERVTRSPEYEDWVTRTHSFWRLVFNPYLERALKAQEEDVVAGMLPVLEDVLATPDVAEHDRTHCLHRYLHMELRGRIDRWPESFFGPRAADLVRSVRPSYERWRPLVEVLDPFFDHVLSEVRGTYPGIHGSHGPLVEGAEWGSGASHYEHGMSVIWDKDEQLSADIMAVFEVRANLANPEDPRFPEIGDRDYGFFWMTHGGGTPSITVGPAFLPDEDDPLYIPTVLQLADEVVLLVDSSLPRFIEALALPLDVEMYWQVSFHPSRWLTAQLRGSEEPHYRRARQFLVGCGSDPARTVLLQTHGLPGSADRWTAANLLIDEDRRIVVWPLQLWPFRDPTAWADLREVGPDEAIITDEEIDKALAILDEPASGSPT